MSARGPWRALVVLVVALALAPLGERALFDSFTSYDDEGIVLLTLRSYARGARLYDDLHAQYGPAYYQVVRGLTQALDAPVTHTTSRWLTLACWLLAAMACAGVTLGATGRLGLAVAVEVVVFAGLARFPNEPLHPGHLLCVLLAGVAWLGTRPTTRTRHLLLGLLVGAACMTKVNVGLFLAIAVGFVLLVRTGVARALWCGLFAAVPVLLMGRALATPWVREYALHVTASALAVALAIAADTRAGEHIRPRDLALVVLGALGVLALSAAIALRDGTSPAMLLDGMLLAPLRLPPGIVGPLLLPTGAFAAALVSLLAALATVWRPPATPTLGAVRLVAGVTLLALGVGRIGLAYGLPLAWLAVAPARDERRGTGATLLAAVATLQVLHAYPVAGSQIGWGTVLLPVLGAVGAARAWDELAPWRAARAWTTRLTPALGGGLLGALALSLGLQWHALAAVHATLVPLGYPGAEHVYASRTLAGTYRWLVDHVRARCASFVAIPGLSSLYLFTEREPPTGVNAGVWTLFLEAERQQAVVDTLRRTPGLCTIRNRALLFAWTGNRAPDGPLWRYVEAEFQLVDARDGYEFMLPRAAAPAP